MQHFLHLFFMFKLRLQYRKSQSIHCHFNRIPFRPVPRYFYGVEGGGGRSFFPKLDLFFYKCHCIYRYIQDEMLENVISVILERKIGYAVYALIFLLCKNSSMKRIVTENMDFQKSFFFLGGGGSFDSPDPPPHPPGTGLPVCCPLFRI